MSSAVQGTANGAKKRQRPEQTWVALTDIMNPASRDEAAKTFYDALVLQSKGLVHIAPQAKPFDVLQLRLVEAE